MAEPPSSEFLTGAPSPFYDWNTEASDSWPKLPALVDETLRDGLQSPSARDPSLEIKLELLHKMSALGIECAALGYPASRPRQFSDVLALAKELARARLSISACCASRALEQDLQPIVDISQQAGVPIQVGVFIGSSPLRQRLAGWSLDDALRFTEQAVRFAVQHGLSVLYVTEDSTRVDPETLARLYTAAIRSGASQICVADTVGHATPRGVTRVIQSMREVVEGCDPAVGIDWHGHRDRGLAVANSLAAWEAGAQRCHGTALGIGERSGNAPIELLLLNLVLLGRRHTDLCGLPDYVAAAASALGFDIPPNHPLVGRDAFRTATGTHADAILRAESLKEPWLAERIYSGVPAHLLGLEHRVEIGPLSGEANVRHWLKHHAVPLDDSLIAAILKAAKQSDSVLESSQVWEIVRCFEE